MKITKQYLKKLITEAIQQNISEAPEVGQPKQEQYVGHEQLMNSLGQMLKNQPAITKTVKLNMDSPIMQNGVPVYKIVAIGDKIQFFDSKKLPVFVDASNISSPLVKAIFTNTSIRIDVK